MSERHQQRCARCKGTGLVPFQPPFLGASATTIICPSCNGTGNVDEPRTVKNNTEHQMIDLTRRTRKRAEKAEGLLNRVITDMEWIHAKRIHVDHIPELIEGYRREMGVETT